MTVAPGFIIAAPQSRSGKTTLTLALMARLVRDNIPVAPFKAGPDYLDGIWHQEIVKRPSFNLDTFMVGPEECRLLFEAQRGDALGIVEGVMGLYDGKSGVGGAGSTADLARVLGLPVLLVVNVRGMAGSLIPLVKGFVDAADGFVIAGILANHVGSLQHAQRLSGWLADHGLPPLLGWMGREEHLALQERHLGLTLPGEALAPSRDRLAAALHLDTECFFHLFKPMPSKHAPLVAPVQSFLSGRNIAIARDAAFSFIYPANVACLARMGATLHFFSPLAGDPLPSAIDAIWLPGGYPELHARALSTSSTLQMLREFGQRGGVILAECGGMMTLGDQLVDHQGVSWPMAGLLPIRTVMTSRLAGLGYREERLGVRGHEFHHSVRDPCPLPPAFSLERGDGGVQWNQVRASYVHWYFPSAPRVVADWLRTC
ncbi:MAG: cobyrinate a,c-diamide synthase [Magnetococcales bacterium]|nr:cobyrinate a,c-diamide synthase [Magnetococcales bacterium]MBF0149849.1 cobyrinate a,c-diamide synthase [Magnetococcales bacterium]MBF0173665.1 cobyrinate a,c-diamide synthase [Magnetococcales bacterium]MBF0346586.1 cobyrinate a,c-diamide synthase [Magnetococcales bacterium]MBF0631145.1 cobyrinate a,c-diamide synthase [Magnetococcales bacterium]